MDSTRRAEILEAYTRHAQRFDKIAAQPFRTTGLFQRTENAPAPESHTKTARRSEPDCLSGREQEVLSLIAWGYSNEEISSTLRITVETVKTHVQHILRRLGARNRAHAVHLGYERGLHDNGPSAPSGGSRRTPVRS